MDAQTCFQVEYLKHISTREKMVMTQASGVNLLNQCQFIRLSCNKGFTNSNQKHIPELRIHGQIKNPITFTVS